jgi:hypothetical protein
MARQSAMKHPHPGRMAEVYRRGEERLIFVRYTADPPPNAKWDASLPSGARRRHRQLIPAFCRS